MIGDKFSDLKQLIAKLSVEKHALGCQKKSLAAARVAHKMLSKSENLDPSERSILHAELEILEMSESIMCAAVDAFNKASVLANKLHSELNREYSAKRR